MKWDDEIEFLDTAKLTKIYNLKKILSELKEIRKKRIEEMESKLQYKIALWHKNMSQSALSIMKNKENWNDVRLRLDK